jgi:O-antigen biosynthesis protein
VSPVAKPGITVIVPVYAGLEETRRCVNSLLESLTHQQATIEIIIIDDCCPEIALSSYCEKISQDNPVIRLLRNEENAGFVKSVNRGMREAKNNDVILLNSDTEVANDWIDRLQTAAYQSEKIATATPFSNNATICSYPEFLQCNSLPEGETLANLDKKFTDTNHQKILDLPTGHGFCLYIRRDALDQLGLFDEHAFARGYGEENDFCCRAHLLGWKNVLACDVFVFHEGSVSFGVEREKLVEQAMQTMAKRYSWYHDAVHSFIEQDPAAIFRNNVDDLRRQESPKLAVLMINHGLGGGTKKHVQDLVKSVQSHFRCFELSCNDGKNATIKSLSLGEGLSEKYQIPAQLNLLIVRLKSLNLVHVHFHHTIGLPLQLFDLPGRLGVEYDFTAHDFFSICPQINLVHERGDYCGEPDRKTCNVCIKQRPAHGATDIAEWRAYYANFLARARYVYCPSYDTATRLQRYFYLPNIIVALHDENTEKVVYTPVPVKDAGHLVICIIGALSKWKGADLLEAVAEHIEKNRLPIRLVLIGFAYRQLNDLSQRVLNITGPYQDDNLDEIIKQYKPHVIWFTSQWPETYSYTLSAALRTECAIVAPDLGAFQERLRDRPLSWILPWNTAPASCADFFMSLRQTMIENKVSFAEPVSMPTRTYLDRYAMTSPVKNPQISRAAHIGKTLYTPGSDAPVYKMRVSRNILIKRALRDRIIAAYRHEKIRPFLRSIVPLKWVVAVDRWLSY